MSNLLWRRTSLRRSLAVCAVAVLGGSVAACGDEEPAGEPARSESSASPATDSGAGGEFCDSVAGIEVDLALLEQAEPDDPAQFVDQISTAAERFASVEPPAEIAESWQRAGEFFTLADEALRDVDVADEEAFQEALRLSDSEDAFVMLIQLPGQMETVGVYVQDECQVDLGFTPPAIDDVCAVVDTANLGSVFDGDVPEGENRRWGGGTVECMWDDRDGHEVGIVVMPAEAMHSELLDGMSPLETVNFDGENIDVYDGAIGPLRSSGGRSAATVVDGTGVLASVRSGDQQAESQKAIALAGLVAVELQ